MQYLLDRDDKLTTPWCIRKAYKTTKVTRNDVLNLRNPLWEDSCRQRIDYYIAEAPKPANTTKVYVPLEGLTLLLSALEYYYWNIPRTDLVVAVHSTESKEDLQFILSRVLCAMLNPHLVVRRELYFNTVISYSDPTLNYFLTKQYIEDVCNQKFILSGENIKGIRSMVDKLKKISQGIVSAQHSKAQINRILADRDTVVTFLLNKRLDKANATPPPFIKNWGQQLLTKVEAVSTIISGNHTSTIYEVVFVSNDGITISTAKELEQYLSIYSSDVRRLLEKSVSSIF